MEIWKKMWVGVFFWTQCSTCHLQSLHLDNTLANHSLLHVSLIICRWVKCTYLNSGQFWSISTLNCPSVRAADFATVPPNSLFIICNYSINTQQLNTVLSIILLFYNRGEESKQYANHLWVGYVRWLQCESKKTPMVFWNFFPNSWEFLVYFYTPIIRSFLH